MNNKVFATEDDFSAFYDTIKKNFPEIAEHRRAIKLKSEISENVREYLQKEYPGRKFLQEELDAIVNDLLTKKKYKNHKCS